MRIIFIFSLLIGLRPSWSSAQRSDPAAAFRTITNDKGYFRFHYDNDFFAKAKTDYYYTQGYSFEVGSPVFRKNPLSKLLLRLKGSEPTYGLAFEHFGFTPTSIRSNEILVGDRPFAGVILLKSLATSVDQVHKQRLSSVLSTGMIGPAAFAGRMQSTIHRWSGDVDPQGWQYQIKNDVAINYELSHERQLLEVPHIVSLHSNAQLRLGTLSDKAQAGFTLTLGKFDSPLTPSKHSTDHNFQLYLYSQSLGAVVGYDATIQGGLFNRNSPYTLKASELNRFTFQNNYGIVLSFWKIYAEYYRTYLSREFKTGREHSWGGVKLGVAF
jgi:lipid A 3-O-deacylase